ncbi:MAG: aldo/keto reductase [Oscillospiraceae bacterium]|nr:aldo/keto reductase [Oscillospiraceae bacterium]
MLFKTFQDIKLSSLGFGTMRLPMMPDGSGEIDQAELDRMVDAAMEAGVNYYDTAFPYHDGKSEVAVGKSLSRYPRESWYLADKFPGHQNVHGVTPLRPEDVFEEQLRRCGVEYFDFYLLHNVNESSMKYYGNPENRYMDFFLEQKRNGRIRHLGFSCHADPECLRDFLALNGDHMEFCQIQLNYVDWFLQNAVEKCRILREAGLPVWVMEPVRGGKLARFPEQTEAQLRELRPDESIPAWAFRWLQTVPKPTVVLSGMSSLGQMEDNIRTFSTDRPLSEKEIGLLDRIGRDFARKIPCTGCRYCCAGCPMELNIPFLLSLANDVGVYASMNTVMRYGSLEPEKRADACIGCGQCVEACPQKINVPEEMKKLAEGMKSQKSWEAICRERAEAAKAGRG